MGVSLYKIKKWYKMLTGKSISHVNQGVGRYYSKEVVAGYYNDLTEKVTKDNPDILVPQYYVDTGEKIYFPIGIFQYGLASYDLFLKTGDEIYKKKLIACADWAVENQQENGGWATFLYKSPEHPYSSMAQGEGISLLIRAYKECKDEKYLSSCHRAKDFMLVSIEGGGTTKYRGTDIFLYEFTHDPLVLNGWIFSAWGLFDYSKWFDDKEVADIYRQIVETIKKTLPRYDTGYWSKYDIRKRIASPFYHNLHIAQLRVMYDLTGDKIFNQYADMFESYSGKSINRSRAFLVKAIQKIFEK